MIPIILVGDGTAKVPVKVPKSAGGGFVYAVIDADDYHLVDDRSWFMKKRNHTTYAHDRAGEPLHLRLFPLADEVDHLDHDGLNCRRLNLRPLSGKRARTLQNVNTRPHRDGQVFGADGRRFKGVRRDGSGYQARITLRGKRKALGHFPTPEEAAIAYDLAVRKHYPGRAVFLNFPEERAP